MRTFLIVMAVAIVACGTAVAQQVDGARPLAASELDALRAGYFTVDGLKFDFAADIRTTVDGRPVLVSRLVWTPEGVKLLDAQGAETAAPDGGVASAVVPGFGGDTLVGHRLTDGALQGFVVNSASNRDVTQNLAVTIALPGFEAVQRDMVQSLTGLQIGRDIANSLVRSSAAQ